MAEAIALMERQIVIKTEANKLDSAFIDLIDKQIDSLRCAEKAPYFLKQQQEAVKH